MHNSIKDYTVKEVVSGSFDNIITVTVKNSYDGQSELMGKIDIPKKTGHVYFIAT
jgi:hypothetical protein